MIRLLAFRQLLVRPVRTAVLLAGFSVGVATMLVLLSVGEAMVLQARDVSLVGGGEVTVLPQGIDVEALRTGALSGMFFGIDRARFVHRQMLGGPRQTGTIAAISPEIEGKVLHLGAGDRVVTVSAGADIPSRAALMGRSLAVRRGTWHDSAADSAWFAPSSQQLFDQLDRFHLPVSRDSTWAEWHYFNLTVSDREWWHLTYRVGWAVPDGAWGGRLLVTRRRSDGRLQEFRSEVEGDRVRLSTTGPDLVLGESVVNQRSGLYFLEGEAESEQGETLRFSLTLRPAARRYFPPLELRHEEFISGYVVPALRASVSGRLCVEGDCVELNGVPGYHDHNWGVWRGVTWEWGQGRGEAIDFLYGGILRDSVGERSRVPFLLAVVDSLGVLQVLRFVEIEFQGEREVPGMPEVRAPERFRLVSRREADSLALNVEVLDARGSRAGQHAFLQLRGAFRIRGSIAGVPVADSGVGFFETFRPTRD